MQNQYTRQAENVINYAATAARENKHPYIGTEHLLLGLCKEVTGVAGQVLAKHGVEEEKLLQLMDELIVPAAEEPITQRPQRSPRFQYILEDSLREAGHLHMDKIGTEHLLLAIIHDADCVAARILTTLNVNIQKVVQDILFAAGMDPKSYQDELQDDRGRNGAVEQFCKDMTAEAEEGKLDPVIGREEEIFRLMQVLSRRTKNNPCLVGEPGVGKTAVLEGLAQRLASDMVPESMKGKRSIPWICPD